MAIVKKKIVVKRKAQGGITLAKNPDTDEKNALKVDVTKPNKDLSEVSKREGFGEQMKKFYKADMAKADSAKTKAGKIARKAVNTITKVAFTPHRLAFNASNAIDNAIANRKEAKAMDKKKMGGKVAKVAKKIAPKVMMKKMSKKK